MTQYLDSDGLSTVWSKFKAYMPKTVAERNNTYREYDITSMYTDGSLWTHVGSYGDFENIYPGCYFDATVNNISGTARQFRFYVLELDTYYGVTDNNGTSKTTHHLLVWPGGVNSFGSSYMNSSNTNSGGYLGSYMYQTTIPKVDEALETVFGSHLLTTTLMLTNNGYSEKPYTYTATDVTSFLLSQYEVFGSHGNDSENDGHYLAAFKMGSYSLNSSYGALRTTGSWWWLRSIGDYSGAFRNVYGSGVWFDDGASFSFDVRPGFLIG